MPVISARGLGYRHATRPQPAFQGVDLDVERGERILITGDSGSGKSTLLSLIAGLAGDDEDGHRLGTLAIEGTVGMVLQDPDSQVIYGRVGDDVAFGAENTATPPAEIWPRVRSALDAVGLDLPLNHPTARLSGGQKQRLALAGILAMGAQIIVLDEPTANLDPRGRAEVISAVDRACEVTGATLIVVEHRPHFWEGVVQKYYRLDGTGLEQIFELPTGPQLPPSRGVAHGTQPAVAADELVTRAGAAAPLRVPEGYSTVITGPNGSGKTTLALTLAGLLQPRAGRVAYSDGIARGLSTAPHTWSSLHLAQRIGYVFQEPEHQFVTSSVRAELELTGASPGRISELTQRFRLTHVMDANPFTLSGGEKRRLSVVTALANAPRLVVLDEPTFGQDDRTFTELAGLLRELTADGVTVVSITHDEIFIDSLGDHTIEVGRGAE
ncbi:ABC transporter ATP-binding protein [Corynebacterium liangguodongii]|uniref:ABC transporter ATP-binding protein n=1 Tax=Corynebacterium liangguodongii TaxID=2079535 RepID=A0A2S0WDF7_9CORY|nr:ABC transporter ATP-binding protein [Corynebacterium liangguodongii]AWB83774.1 ABC transporter ATP-binding protein [Corynebacterium liangguodongii]PWB98649.1 ABC transporter ATP-binding protein [Corynebacterium liangguodongii]